MLKHLLWFAFILVGSAPLAQAACVISKDARLLTEELKPKHKVGRYTPLMVLKSPKNGFAKVEDQDGKKYWVSAMHVKMSGMDCVAIKSEQAPLYRLPCGSEVPAELKRMSKGSPFKKINRDYDYPEWFIVQDNFDHQYCVHERHVWEPLTRRRVDL